MNKLITLTLTVLCFGTLLLNAQITDYNWPTPADVTSDKYEIKAREIASDGTAGDWLDLTEFYSVPRIYDLATVEDIYGFPASEFETNGNDIVHNIAGGNAVTGVFDDRSLTYVQFSFEGNIEVEVTKLYGSAAPKVEISPKAYGINPHYFNGTTVRFYMDKPEYVSVNFVVADNQDDGYTWENVVSKKVKNPLMIFADVPEEISNDYTIPQPTDEGVVVWGDDVDIATLQNAGIIYFPAGDHNMKNHKDNVMTWETNEHTFENYPLYHGQYRMKKAQKIYLEGGAYVRGCFHAKGYDGSWLYGRGIISGKNHLMHEILVPEIVDGEWVQKTQTKEAFVEWIGVTNGKLMGVVIADAYHHTCPSGNNTTIKDLKIIGWSSNNDGIRPGEGSFIDHVFMKSSDDLDYARSPHIVQNSIFWPHRNGAAGMLGWGNLGTGYAQYKNNYVINAEWDVSLANKGNQGIICGGKADDGIKLIDNVVSDYVIENSCNYLVGIMLEKNGSIDEGHLKNFTFKNITTENRFQTPGGVLMKQEMVGLEDNWIEGFTFTNLIVGGILVTWDNYKDFFNLNLAGSNGNNTDNSRYVKDVTFNTEGDILEVELSYSSGGVPRPVGKDGIVHMLEAKDQTFYFEPSNGYGVDYIVVDNDTLHGGRNTFTFKNVGKNHKLHVQFKTGAEYFEENSAATEFVDIDTAYIENMTTDTVVVSQNVMNTSTTSDTIGSIIYDTIIKEIERELEVTINLKVDTIYIDRQAEGEWTETTETITETIYEVTTNTSFYFNSVNEHKTNNDFIVSPNPADKRVLIDLSESASSKHPFNIKLLNTNGQVLYSETSTTAKHEIDLSDVKPGMYLVQCYDSEYQLHIKKLIKL